MCFLSNILDLFSNLKIHQRNKKPPLTPPRPPLPPPKDGNKKILPKEGNKPTPPREGNNSPPSEGSGAVSYRLAKRSNDVFLCNDILLICFYS
ncbi:MAG: hypothetical protein LBC74_10560 [Planctomycetaceae bacterium]|nr:hypothetical protein [Planctomycetaceae bacterium]